MGCQGFEVLTGFRPGARRARCVVQMESIVGVTYLKRATRTPESESGGAQRVVAEMLADIEARGEQSVRDYARQVGFTDEYNLIPYEAMQPPLYYLAAGLFAKLLPADPQAILRLARLLSVLFGAATVAFCWAAVRQLAVQLMRDDGGIVYLNGIEVFRSNMPVGEITSTTRSANIGMYPRSGSMPVNLSFRTTETSGLRIWPGSCG